MNSIEAIIYSYKGKQLKDVVENLINNTDNEIFITIIDQSPLIKDYIFKDYKNVKYRHVVWDSHESPCDMKLNAIQSSNSDYVLLVGDNVMVKKSWDTELIGFLDNKKAIVSGKGNTYFKLKDNFSFEIVSEDLMSTQISNVFTRDFAFGKGDILKQFEYPRHLKYYGENETVSILLYCSGIDIYSYCSNLYSKISENIIETIYTPFSLVHNYNEFVRLIKHGNSRFINIQKHNQRTVKDFINFHGIEIDKIYELPFEKNDPKYNHDQLAFQAVQGERFIGITRSIR
jgi:hypothetical protein